MKSSATSTRDPQLRERPEPGMQAELDDPADLKKVEETGARSFPEAVLDRPRGTAFPPDYYLG